MSEVTNIFREEATFLKLESDTCVAEARKYAANENDMFIHGFQN